MTIWLEDLGNHLRYAWRMLVEKPLFSSVAVLTWHSALERIRRSSAWRMPYYRGA